MSSRVRRLTDSAGQTAAEYLGVLVVIAAIIAGVATTSAGEQIKTGILCQISKIAGDGGACESGDDQADETEIDEECVVSTSTSSANVGGTVAFIEVGQGNVLIEERLADGTTRVTLLDKGTVAAKALAGGKLKLGKFGGDWSAEASAGLDLSGAKVYEFPPDERGDAEDFVEALGNEGTFSQLIEDGFRGTFGLPGLLEQVPGGSFLSDPLGIKDAAGDFLFGEDDIEMPEPDSVYVEGGIVGDAEATGALGIGALSGEVSGALETAQNLKVTTSGDDKGQIEASYKIDAEVAGQLAGNLGIVDGGLGGEAGVGMEAKVTFGTREDGSYGPVSMELTTTAQAAGNASLEAGLSGQNLEDATKGYLKDLTVGSEENTGKKLETTLELDLSDDAVAGDTLDLITGQGSGSDLVDSLSQNAKATISLYDTQSSDTSGEIAGGAGINLGLEGGQQSESETLDESVVAEPGEGFRRRECGQ